MQLAAARTQQLPFHLIIYRYVDSNILPQLLPLQHIMCVMHICSFTPEGALRARY
jgi:hypothetical protein